MHIGILTQKWDSNYGGILQAAALQRVLQQLGHDVTVLDRRAADFRVGSKRFKDRVSAAMELFGLHRLKTLARLKGFSPSLKQRALLRQHEPQESFIRRNLNLSPLCHHPVSPQDAAATGAEAWVVGSDQVWRYAYQNAIRDCFLTFCTPEQRQKSITYAPSFGHDTWDAPAEDTEACRRLLADFKAVSVREESGCELCRRTFGREAVFMPDPTLLLTAEDYCRMSELPAERPQGNYIAYYVLDMNPEVRDYIHRAEKALGMKAVDIMFDLPAEKRRKKDRKTPFRPVEEWIDLLSRAAFVITDSFHGSVFSTLFRKDFVCLGNMRRGGARFETLFGKLDLWDRMAEPTQPFEAARITPERWERIHSVIEELRRRGRSYLEENLK
ncbi:MAG: polysaccharide pyruvyl transferase family protein [Akkermansia sp.]|nr:polysaccharide pyruvyl transferase family protein [Akkermansia sp.]